MDAERFDAMIKRLGTTRLTRMRALRGVAASAVAALIGAALLPADAADRHRRRRKRTICHCPDTDPKNCKTLRLRRKRAKRHLRQHPNDYKGECRKQPNPAPTCTTDVDCAGPICCTTGKKAGTCQPNVNAC